MAQRVGILNLVKSALNPSMLPVMLRKAWKRIVSPNSDTEKKLMIDWLIANRTDLDDWANQLNPDLWLEALKFSKRLEKKAADILNTIDYDLGGGGCYPLLYFLVRIRQPEVVLETGVAAGFSSHSILSAMEENGKGTLYSSDFPYFRIPNPKQYIGIIVPEELRRKWHLYVEGDRKNIPAILTKFGSIDLLHYDSDKTYSGRQFVLEAVKPKLNANSIIIVDDIQDNTHFKVFVQDIPPDNWHVFGFEGKYIGLVISS